MRCTRERSGAAITFVGESLTGGMGGDYTYVPAVIKAHPSNSTRPQAEVEHHRGMVVTIRPFCRRFIVLLATIRVFGGSPEDPWNAAFYSSVE
jgi:hypothetical protein